MNRSPRPLCQVSALIAQQKMVAEQRLSSEAALREGVPSLSPSFAVSVYPSALLFLFLLLNDSLYFLLNP